MTWLKRLVVALTILTWIVLVIALLWVIGHVVQAVILLSIAALIAYAIYPAVKLLQRVMPRTLAIVIVYLLLLGVISVLLYFIAITAIAQVSSLVTYVEALLTPGSPQLKTLLQALNQFGISQVQLQQAGQQLIAQLQGVVNHVLPLLSSLFSVFINVVLVATLSIYFLIGGPKTGRWLERNTPLRQRHNLEFLMDTVEQVVGGYIRGSLLLSVIVSVLTGIGLAVLGVPYALLLAVLTFVVEFIPIIGTYISGVACVLAALTQGWLTVILTVILVVVIQEGLAGQIIMPRMLGRAVGLNPIVAIFALVAGGELFGLLGALFAAPVAGVLQAVLISFWRKWQTSHPEQFPHVNVQQKLTQDSDKQTKPSEKQEHHEETPVDP